MIVGHPRRISPPKMTHDHGSPCGPSAVGGEKTRSARSVSPAYPGPEGGMFGFGRGGHQAMADGICGSLAP